MATTTPMPEPLEYGVPIGKYGLAYRFYNSRRDVYSGMSQQVFFDVKAGNAHFSAPELVNSSPARGFDVVQTFRTVDGGARLYQDGSFKSGEVPTWAEELSDLALQYQDVYEPFVDEVRRPPTSRRIAYYDGTMFAEDDRGIKYSPTHRHQPEVFNSTNLSRVDTADGKLVSFVESGDFLFALYPTLVKRFFKQGTVASENNLHRGWGPVSRSCAVPVASSVMMLTPKGIVSVSPDGQPTLHAQANRLFVAQLADSWFGDVEADLASPLPNICAAIDDLMSCAIFVNRAKQRALVFWIETERVSVIEDWPWTLACTGSDPVRGGARRAWFYGMEVPDSPDTSFSAHNDRIWTLDALQAADTRTMLGLSAGMVLNGAAAAPSGGSTLTRAGAGWTSECVGAFVHVFTGYGEAATDRRRSRVISATSDALTLYPSVGPIAVGDEFHVSCIPLVVAGQALAGDGPATDLSYRRLVNDMNLCLGVGCPPSAGSYVRMAILGEDGATALDEKAVEASLDFDMMHCNVSAQDRAVFPRWSSYWSDEPLEVLQGRVGFRKGESQVN